MSILQEEKTRNDDRSNLDKGEKRREEKKREREREREKGKKKKKKKDGLIIDLWYLKRKKRKELRQGGTFQELN